MVEQKLICQECNQEYTLSGEDNPEDFECVCGGDLRLVEKPVPEPNKESDIETGAEGRKKRRIAKPEYSKNIAVSGRNTKKVFLIGLGVIFGLFLIMSAFHLLNTTINIREYNDQGISFNYISGWNIRPDEDPETLIMGSYTTGDGTGIVLLVSKTATDRDLSQTAAAKLRIFDSLGTIKDSEFTNINQERGYVVSFDSAGVNNKVYTFVKDGYEYQLWFKGNTFQYRRSMATILDSFTVN